jgi:hypothetical protein
MPLRTAPSRVQHQARPGAKPPSSSSNDVWCVNLNELRSGLDKAAIEIAAQVRSADAAPRKRELEVLIRRTLAKTVTDIFSAKDHQQHYRGVREDGNPVTFLIKHYKPLIEGTDFFQADLSRRDPKLLDALRNASKSKYWRHLVRGADAELQRDMGPGAITVRDTRVSEAESLADLLLPRKNLYSLARPHARLEPAPTRPPPPQTDAAYNNEQV